MFNKKIKIVAFSVCAVLAVGVGIYGFKASAGAMSFADRKAAYEKAWKEFKQEQKTFEKATLPTTEEGINERYKKGLELKQKAADVSEMGKDFRTPKAPEDPKKTLEEDIEATKGILLDDMGAYDPNDSYEGKVLENMKRKLAILDQIEKDFKENKKPLEEIRKDFEVARKIKIH